MDRAIRSICTRGPIVVCGRSRDHRGMRFPVTLGRGSPREASLLRLRATIRSALPPLLVAAGLALVVTGSPGLGWALLVFGLGLAPLLSSQGIAAATVTARYEPRGSNAPRPTQPPEPGKTDGRASAQSVRRRTRFKALADGAP